MTTSADARIRLTEREQEAFGIKAEHVTPDYGLVFMQSDVERILTSRASARQPANERRKEWRVVGIPERDCAPYVGNFPSERKARAFVSLVERVDVGRPWVDGPHIEHRTVTDWERREVREQ